MNRLGNKLLGIEPMVYRGGGKSGGGATATAPAMMTTTTLGEGLSIGTETLKDDTQVTDDAVAVKKEGTRGLQIPLADKNTTTTAASTGVQI